MKLKVYGCRGSAACPGGNTSCYKLISNGETLLLDAGSGLPMHEAEPTNILISHLHLDHIIGLATFKPIWDKNGGVRIFTRSRSANKDMTAQVFGAFKPPYWPVQMENFTSAEVNQIRVNENFTPGGVFNVTAFDANHPDLTASFRISDGQRTLVYLLDYEVRTLPATAYGMLVENCRGADMIVFDATYHPDDYETHKGFGHSTPLDGIKLAGDCGAAQMLFTHFSPEYSNDDILKWQGLLDGVKNPERFVFARDGMELEI